MPEVVRIGVRGDSPYDVVIGNNTFGGIVSELADSVAKVAIIHPGVLVERAVELREQLVESGRDAITIEVPDAEAAKNAEVLAYCWSVLGQAGFTRTDAIVGLGGGATTDLAGFVAASWLRGVTLIQVPTTLLAMVDAAVGGKTGINTAEGKNLVGAFYHPRLVVSDLDFLATMNHADLIGGLAEVIKCGFIADPAILDLVEADPQVATDPSGPVMRELIERAVQVKADVVSDDFKEVIGGPTSGGVGREMLNYGHTLAHAIERFENYTWRHGEAVSVGMVFVAELAARNDRITPDMVGRHRDVLGSVGLPISYPSGRFDELMAAMKLDKKARADTLRFVVLEGIAQPAILTAPDPATLIGAYEAISE